MKLILKVLMRLVNEHLQNKFYKNIIKIIPKLSSIITKYARCLLYECRDAYILSFDCHEKTYLLNSNLV